MQARIHRSLKECRETLAKLRADPEPHAGVMEKPGVEAEVDRLLALMPVGRQHLANREQPGWAGAG